jgi:HD-like signal output (HDOD) protein
MMVKNENWNLIEAERHIFDTDHTEVGSWMAGRWNLPPELVQSIGFHHKDDITALPHARIVAVVHAASICADTAETLSEESTELPEVPVPPFIETMLGISKAQFGEIVQDLHRRRAEIQLAFR